ncbi:MAG TPA: hypothetical protein VFM25_14020 [Verrucomicrobiae bacterium]|nr:hypothetical protein [Verrucomicrobiae bacterium]
MIKSLILAAVVGGWFLPKISPAQDAEIYVPPPPPTKLETLETNTGTIIIKGTGLVGSLSLNSVVVTVTCKEDTNLGSGQKEFGIAIDMGANPRQAFRTILDYDELAPLLNAMDYLAKVDWSVTSLSSFSASFTTKGGFRIAAFSSKRATAIDFSIRDEHMNRGVLLTQTQLAQFRSLIEQAKTNLDGIRGT